MEEETQPNWNMQEPGELLPFLSEKLVNELAQKYCAAHGAEGLEEFLPFMGEKNVDQLAREWKEQGEDVECLMPFMSHGMLRQLAMEHVQEHGLSGLGRLAKLLDTDTLQDILKKALG